jgi:hypothetical protein
MNAARPDRSAKVSQGAIQMSAKRECRIQRKACHLDSAQDSSALVSCPGFFAPRSFAVEPLRTWNEGRTIMPGLSCFPRFVIGAGERT